jgi:hypothetical protein
MREQMIYEEEKPSFQAVVEILEQLQRRINVIEWKLA